MESIIFCSECKANGYKPTKLGVNVDAAGKLKLWCKRCKKEILVVIHGEHIHTIAAADANNV